MLDALKGKKTYITAVMAVVAAVGAYLLGNMDMQAMIEAVVAALMAAFLRNGIANSGN